MKKGVIVDNAPPNELVKKIEGKVWSVPVAEVEVTNMQKHFRVINIARDQQNSDVILRILSEDKPTDTAKSITPTLEDYYLYVFGANAETALVV